MTDYDRASPRDYPFILALMPRPGQDEADPSPMNGGMVVVPRSEWNGILKLVERSDPALAEALDSLFPPGDVEVRSHAEIPSLLPQRLQEFLLRPHDLSVFFPAEEFHIGHFAAYFAVQNTLKKILAICQAVVTDQLAYRAGLLV